MKTSSSLSGGRHSLGCIAGCDILEMEMYCKLNHRLALRTLMGLTAPCGLTQQAMQHKGQVLTFSDMFKRNVQAMVSRKLLFNERSNALIMLHFKIQTSN